MHLDPDRFWKLLEPLYSQAELFARHMAPRAWEDVLQEALLKALNKLDSLRQEELFKYWLFRIIANEARRAHRRDFWKRWLPLPGMEGDPTEGAGYREAEADRLDLQHLKAALARMPIGKRQTLLLYHIAGFSVAEIASMREESEGAVKSRLSRGRQELKRALGGELPLAVIRRHTNEELDHEIEQCIQAAGPKG